MSFLECCTVCLRQVSISALRLVSISVWTALSVNPGRLETLEHLFLSCAFAKEVWGWAPPPLLQTAW